jgi:hypothetical protein
LFLEALPDELPYISIGVHYQHALCAHGSLPAPDTKGGPTRAWTRVSIRHGCKPIEPAQAVQVVAERSRRSAS